MNKFEAQSQTAALPPVAPAAVAAAAAPDFHQRNYVTAKWLSESTSDEEGEEEEGSREEADSPLRLLRTPSSSQLAVSQ